mmetsp:Transcript_19147/g.29949  ORF Transcript_19147/g.29949 Transcript_19147/m.29949 type:complete len:229 (+) Transcript_19147:179-865(+)
MATALVPTVVATITDTALVIGMWITTGRMMPGTGLKTTTTTTITMGMPGTDLFMETETIGVVDTTGLTTGLIMEMETIGMVVTRAAARAEPIPRSVQLCHQLSLLLGKATATTTATEWDTIPTRTENTPITAKEDIPTITNQVHLDPITEISQITIKQIPTDPTMEEVTVDPIHRTIKETLTAVGHLLTVETRIKQAPMDPPTEGFTDHTQKTTTPEDQLLTVEDTAN